jgi:hypothetical protein
MNERTVLKYILKKGWEGMYWIDLAQNRDQGQPLVNMVMTL